MGKKIDHELRKTIKYVEIDRHNIVKVRKARNGDLFIILPKEIIDSYHLKAGDSVIFMIIDKTCFAIGFPRTQKKR